MIVTPTGEQVFTLTCRRCSRPDWAFGVDQDAAVAQLRRDGWSDDEVCLSCQAERSQREEAMEATHACETLPEPFDRGGF